MDPISNNIPIAKLTIPLTGVPPIFAFNRLSKPSEIVPSKESEGSSLYSSLSSENSISSNLVLDIGNVRYSIFSFW